MTNTTAQPVDWQVTVHVAGTLTTHWNAVASTMSGDIVFEGVQWNDIIDPMGNASFGYCASK